MSDHKGEKSEEKSAPDKSLPDPNSACNLEFKCAPQTIADPTNMDTTKVEPYK